MTRLRAPEGVSSASVEHSQYEVADGHIEVDNPEHVAHLRHHGFEHADDAVLSHSDPVIEPAPLPDFSRFVNRQALVDYLAAHGDRDHRAGESRADLEAACLASYQAGTERVRPEAAEVAEETELEEEAAEETELEEETAEATEH